MIYVVAPSEEEVATFVDQYHSGVEWKFITGKSRGKLLRTGDTLVIFDSMRGTEAEEAAIGLLAPGEEVKIVDDKGFPWRRA